MKILYVTTVGSTMSFFKKLISELIDEGHTIDIATNQNEKPLPEEYLDYGCKVFNISCTRSPFSKGTIKAVQELSKIVSENDYDIVHCHTPIASICTRLACKKYRKKGLKVIYTAHGFHFYKGAPLKNWLIYYPIEKICSKFTDILITINKEDYELAKSKMKADRIEYVPGVGIDVDHFRNTKIDKKQKRMELGIPESAFLLLSVGELNANKNHEVVIKALAQIGDSNIHYMIAGKGTLDSYLLDLSHKLGVKEQVHLLGFRTDVAELYKVADLYILPSLREGLNVSIMEAMASELDVICGNIRGNIDLNGSGKSRVFVPNSVNECKGLIEKATLRNTKEKCDENKLSIESLDVKNINLMMTKIYGIKTKLQGKGIIH